MLAVGSSLPVFTLRDQTGAPVTSASLLVGGPLVVFFYPRAETPGCTLEARGFRDEYAAFLDRGATVVGISGDSPERQTCFQDNERLPYKLLCDEDYAVHRAFGLKKLFGLLPPRTTFVFDATGRLAAVHDSILRPVGHVTAALQAVRSVTAANPVVTG